MDKLNLVSQLQPMLMGTELDQALAVLPAYDPNIINESDAARLIALSDIYNIFVPTQMSREIYLKIYLGMTRPLTKKGDLAIVRQFGENRKMMLHQECHGVLGGADSFSVIGVSGIGKSTSISRAIQLITQNQIIELDKPYMKVIPCVCVQCPFDSSVRSLLLSILASVDEHIGSSYHRDALRFRATTDTLIGSVSQVASNHIAMICIDEVQNIVNHRNGQNLIGCLTQLINNSGISIALIGTPECADFFSQAMHMARRSLGLQYEQLPYGTEFQTICQVLFQYQYLRKRTDLDETIMRWLYEHSGGNVSVLVSLVHDANEIAILSGTEELSLRNLQEAYQQRMAMLHSYIAPKKRSQTSNVKKRGIPLVASISDATDYDISISELIRQAKSEGRDIVSFLATKIHIEEVRL